MLTQEFRETIEGAIKKWRDPIVCTSYLVKVGKAMAVLLQAYDEARAEVERLESGAFVEEYRAALRDVERANLQAKELREEAAALRKDLADVRADNLRIASKARKAEEFEGILPRQEPSAALLLAILRGVKETIDGALAVLDARKPGQKAEPEKTCGGILA